MYLSNKLLVATSLFLLLAATSYLVQQRYTHYAAKRQLVTIVIKDGVYQPAEAKVTAGQPVRLHFVRGEPGACTDHVYFPQFNAVYALSALEPTDIDLPAMTRGEVAFQCVAGTYRGKLTVV